MLLLQGGLKSFVFLRNLIDEPARHAIIKHVTDQPVIFIDRSASVRQTRRAQRITEEITSMSKFSVKKPMTIFVAVVLVCILGFISFTSMRTDLLPKMDLPYVMVLTTYPGASPEKIEQTVTKPLEQTLATTSGIKNVTSTSNENSSMVLLEFTQGTNMDSAMIEMSGKIDMVKGSLDDAVGTPTLLKICLLYTSRCV